MATPGCNGRRGRLKESRVVSLKGNPPQMPDNPPETIPWRVAALERDFQVQIQKREREIEHLQKELDSLRERFDARERRMLIAAITIMGGFMVSLLGVIWTNLGAFFPGRG